MHWFLLAFNLKQLGHLVTGGRGKQAGGTNERHNSQQAVCHKKQARRIQS